MKTKLASAAIVLALTTVLLGCTPHQTKTVATDKASSWIDAAKEFKLCRKARWDQIVAFAPQWNQLVTGTDDPQYFEKMTSKADLTVSLKESLIKFRPQQIACRKAFFESLGDNHQEVKMMYQKNFNDLDDGIVKILDGKLKTMGEVNQVYVAYNHVIAERRARLMTHLLNN